MFEISEVGSRDTDWIKIVARFLYLSRFYALDFDSVGLGSNVANF